MSQRANPQRASPPFDGDCFPRGWAVHLSERDANTFEVRAGDALRFVGVSEECSKHGGPTVPHFRARARHPEHPRAL
eukprot:scaffold977_cov253-Pinguiococcus_pyrenoidosus.AAC.6